MRSTDVIAHSSRLKEINCCSKISLLQYVLVNLLQWAKPKSIWISVYHKFLLLLSIQIFSYCIVVSVGGTSDRLVPARNNGSFPTKEPHSHDQAHSGIQLSTSQALSLYLSPETSAELRMLIWCFAGHKHSLEQQCLLILAYALWFPLCKLYMILRIPYQYLPIDSIFVPHLFHFTKDAVCSFTILWIFYNVVHISL